MADLDDLDCDKGVTTRLHKLTMADLQRGITFYGDVEEDFELEELYVSGESDSENDSMWKLGEPSGEENKSVNLYNPPEIYSEKSFECLTPDGGVKKLVLRQANGVKPPEGSKLFYEYVAFIEGSSEHFDARTGKRTEETILDDNCDLIKGLKLALASMEVYEESQFLLHFDYAFGPLGCPPRIPAASSVIMNVRIVKYLSPEQLKDVLLMSQQDRNKLEFGEVFQAAKDVRQTGNTQYTNKNFGKAIREYRRAIDILENYGNISDEQVGERARVLASCYCNMAQSYLKLGKGPQACNACKNGLAQPVSFYNDKLLFRFAKAKYLLDSYTDALSLLERSRHAGADKASCDTLRQEILREKESSEARHREMCKRMFP